MEQGSKPSNPTHQTLAAFTIIENNDRAVWRRVGTGVVNPDGSINLTLDALPVNGKLHLRPI